MAKSGVPWPVHGLEHGRIPEAYPVWPQSIIFFFCLLFPIRSLVLLFLPGFHFLICFLVRHYLASHPTLLASLFNSACFRSQSCYCTISSYGRATYSKTRLR
jgi:hypothetical protein